MTAPTDLRRHILAVSMPLLLSRGFTAVGLTEILSTAGVPKGSFYHYFASKEAFGEALLDGYFAEYHARMDALLTQRGSAADRLLAYFDDWLVSQTGEEAQPRCLVVKLGAEVCDLSESMRNALERGTRGIIDRLAACIEDGQRDGSLLGSPEARATAVTLYQNWLGASLLAKIARDRGSLLRALDDTRERLQIGR